MEKLVLDLLLPFIGLTWFFTQADGPWDIMLKIRRAVGVETSTPTFFGKLLRCGGCTAAWAGGLVGVVQAIPYIVPLLGIEFQYPMWLAWLARGPFAAMGLIVFVDLWKPYPPLDLSGLAQEEDDGEGQE